MAAIQQIVQALQATTNPGDHTEATEYLNKCSAMIGFPNMLLEVVGDEAREVATRQAAVIYLKNMVSRSWDTTAADSDATTPMSEQDKVQLRAQIISRLVDAPEPIRLRTDFPERFNVIDEVFWLLNSDDVNKNMCALIVTHRLTKVYEYKRTSDKAHFIQAMQRLLPALLERFKQLLSNSNQESCRLQNYIMKIFYCTVQFSLSKELITAEAFGHWLELFIVVIERPVPPEVDAYEDKEDTIYWRCKKWALKIIDRVFEKYGSKGHVEAIYNDFADYYTKHYAEHVIVRVMHVLEQHAQGIYVTPRVLSLCLSHLSETLTHAAIWKLVKDRSEKLFVEVLYPLLKFTDEDEETWRDDPEAYLQEKADCFEELRCPNAAAVQLVRVIARRKGVLLFVLEHVFGRLQDATANPRDIDGALNVIGALGEILCSDRRYKNDVDRLLLMHVLPRLTSNVAYVRARAFQVIREMSQALYKTKGFLSDIAAILTQRLQSAEEELPVKYEVALALQALLSDQEEFQSLLKPHVGQIIVALLTLMTQTHVDELPTVVETVIETFEEEMIPIAEQLVAQLIQILEQVALTDDGEGIGDDNGGMTTMGLMSNLQTILYLIEDRPDVVAKVEPMVRNLILHVFDAYAGDYFDDCINMTEYLIKSKIAPDMWQVYDKFDDVFASEGAVFFNDAMPCYHKFVVTDTEAFLSDPNRPRKLLVTCGKVLQDVESGDDIRINAAKLLEVMLLQCPGHLDAYVDEIIDFTWSLFNQSPITFQPFDSQLAVTLIAAFIYNAERFVAKISTLAPHHHENLQWMFDRVFRNVDALDGQHDRVMVLVFFYMGLRFPKDARPQALIAKPAATIGTFVKMLSSINRCRQIIAQGNESDSEDSDEEDEDANDSKRNIEPDLNDSDDDIEASKEHLDYLQYLEHASDSDDSESRHSFVEATDMEEYSTPYDGDHPRVNVYSEFMVLLHDLEQHDPPFYGEALTLQESEKKELEEILTLCRREQERLRSNAVEKSGGFAFDAAAEIPMSFKFS